MGKKATNKDTRTASKIAEYKEFVLWATIPTRMKKMSKEEMRAADLPQEYLPYAEIDTQKALAKHLKVAEQTLTEWRKKTEFWDDVDKQLKKNIKNYYKPRIDHAFAQKTEESGDAARVKLWKQLYEGFEEASTVNHNVKLSKTVSDVELLSIDNIFALVVGKLAAKGYLDLIKTMARLQDGFYGRMNAALQGASPDEMSELQAKQIYPSNMQYDFEHIAEVNGVIDISGEDNEKVTIGKSKKDLEALLKKGDKK